MASKASVIAMELKNSIEIYIVIADARATFPIIEKPKRFQYAFSFHSLASTTEVFVPGPLSVRCRGVIANSAVAGSVRGTGQPGLSTSLDLSNEVVSFA